MGGPKCQQRKSGGFCMFGGRQRGRKYSSAFKAQTLPPCAFVFCPGNSAILLLKAWLMYADRRVDLCAWERDKEHYSDSGRWVMCAPFPPYSMDSGQLWFFFTVPVFMLLQFKSLHPPVLSSSSDSSCSSTSSHLSLLCLTLSFRSVLELSVFEWERGNACVLVFVRRAKL